MITRRAGWPALVLLLSCWSLLPRAEQVVPELTGPVTDTTGALASAQRAELEATLRDFEGRKGAQLAVLIVATTQPESIEQYALRVVERWKLGRSKVDDGALLLVATDDRTLRIEVGYGLEGALNDATCKRIISEIIVPSFRAGDVYGGIREGVAQMIRVVDGEPLPPPAAGHSGNATEQALPALFIAALLGGGILRAVLGRLPGAVVTGALVGGLAWLLAGTLAFSLLAGALALLFTLMGGGLGRSTYPGGFGGGMGGGGFGGGGFSGGGGGFGGGGASGRW